VLVVEGLRITEQVDFGLVSILARRGADPAKIGTAIGGEMPTGPRWIAGRSAAIIGTGPGSWLAYRALAAPGWRDDLARALTGLASLSDQSGAYRLFRLEGPRALTLLQRGIALDLDACQFVAGSVALTSIAHIDVVVRKLDEDDAYELAVTRSYAESFLRWLDAATMGL
jgi:heterotetrameric sarcosine oxidase gamma subunit